MKLRVSCEMGWLAVDVNENEDEDEDERRELPVDIVLLLQKKSSSIKRAGTS
jgi:hypothetical protein